MELKKSQKASLERRRPVFFLAGTLIALSVSLAAFEYRSYYDIKSLGDLGEQVEKVDLTEILREITLEEEPKDEVKEEVNKNTDQLDIVEDFLKKDRSDELFKDPFKKPVDLGDVGDIEFTDDEPDPIFESPTLDYAQIMPSFKCATSEELSHQKILRFVQSRVAYPERAKELGVSGTVQVQFVIDKFGTLTKAKVVQGIHPDCDKEALRVIQEMTNWCAGMQNGKYRSVRMTLPVKFVLL